MLAKVKVPPEFKRDPFFFAQDVISFQPPLLRHKTHHQPIFIYDIVAKEEGLLEAPWNSLEDCIPSLFIEWKTQEKILHEQFSLRKVTNAKEIVTEWSGRFLSALFWINGGPLQGLTALEANIQKLTYKPVNTSERVLFLLKKPGMYHSFVQLSELYTELQKQYAIKRIRLKK
ncbi:YpoC family protein [Priestia flexa]|uniref:YpoC-like domain-containing protein n=2 Tax=Priestia TaxID=2800373 RepID=A0A0V8JLJ5_9BACI|nr:MULTISPECIES: hypothetical protein [Bacillaceae]KSU87873.1 hypothetical protein AS180_10705 [Priestia veravalensis]KZB90681.1 hypothetical protein A2U94_14655 [Bacillus sp. VT 712]MCM3065678.1 hypothetical protein [Priestia flexa]MCP1188821.1 hypothetical protein [Priestia flexa]MDW8515165.1 hypothetical protein [Priestia flexa]